MNRHHKDIGSYWSKWAKAWDPLLSFVGLNMKYRRQGISALDLEEGMTVLDVLVLHFHHCVINREEQTLGSPPLSDS